MSAGCSPLLWSFWNHSGWEFYCFQPVALKVVLEWSSFQPAGREMGMGDTPGRC